MHSEFQGKSAGGRRWAWSGENPQSYFNGNQFFELFSQLKEVVSNFTHISQMLKASTFIWYHLINTLFWEILPFSSFQRSRQLVNIFAITSYAFQQCAWTINETNCYIPDLKKFNFQHCNTVNDNYFMWNVQDNFEY